MPSSACPRHSGIWSLEVQLYLFVIWTVDEGEFQLHLPDSLPWGKGPRHLLKGTQAEHNSSSGRLGKEKTSCSCLGLKHYFSVIDIITASDCYSEFTWLMYGHAGPSSRAV